MKTASRAGGRSGERGIALILTLLVLLVLLAVVSQLTLSTRLDYQSAQARSSLARIDRALESALLDAADVLKDDAEGGGGADDAAGSLSDLLGGGASGGGGNPFAAAGGGSLSSTSGGGPSGNRDAAGPGGGPGGGAQGSFDCANDGWAEPSRHTTQDIEVTVLIEDENRKFNVLSIASPDEEFARQSRDRLVRILDSFREGTEYDLDLSTAESLSRDLEDWLLGKSRTEDLPRPALLSNEEDSQVTLPFSTDELLLVAGFEPGLLYDFRIGDLLVPGLDSHLTVWTALAVAPEGAGEGGLRTASQPGTGLVGGAANARSPSASGTPTATGGRAAAASAGGETAPGSTAGGGGSGGGAGTRLAAAINVNTAPRAVLASLLPPSDVPSEAIEALLRFRNEKQDEEEGVDDETRSAEEELGLTEEEDPPRKFFRTLDELDQVPEFGNLFPDVKQRFKELLTTESEVFTIRATARIRAEGNEDLTAEDFGEAGWEEEGPGLTRRIRSVVLRRQGDAGTEILPIVRWEVRVDRRLPIPDFAPEDMPQ